MTTPRPARPRTAGRLDPRPGRFRGPGSGSGLRIGATATLAAAMAAGTLLAAPAAGATSSAAAPSLTASPAAAAAAPRVRPRTERVSLSRTNTAPNNYSREASISANGRYVAFTTAANNVVAGDSAASWDVVVRDRVRKLNILVSVSSTGRKGNGRSLAPSISADGRFVAFTSEATNLVPGDTNRRTDVFVRDLVRRTTVRVNVRGSTAQGNADARYPLISANGRFVVFTSSASNLVAGDTNLAGDVFVRDLVARRTERVSVTGSGGQLRSPSIDGAISGDGRYVSFATSERALIPGGGNGYQQVFVRDRRAGRTLWLPVGRGGSQPNGHTSSTSLSANGRYVVFESSATNLVAGDTNGQRDVFLFDRNTRRTERVNVAGNGRQANGTSTSLPFRHPVSDDGRFVAFESNATTLVRGDTNRRLDVFVRDRRLRVTQRVSVSTGGGQGNNNSFAAAMTGNARYVVFTTAATNLVPADGRNGDDVLLRDRGT